LFKSSIGRSVEFYYRSIELAEAFDISFSVKFAYISAGTFDVGFCLYELRGENEKERNEEKKERSSKKLHLILKNILKFYFVK